MDPKKDLLDRQLNLKTARAWSLVLLAMGIEHRLEETGTGRVQIILATPEDRERALNELSLWRDENTRARWREREFQTRLAPKLSGLGFYLGFGLILIHWVVLTERSLDLVALGRFDTRALATGEWWRIVTAIGLHADWGHLLSNLAFGLVLITALALALGSGASLWVALSGGAFANLINFLIHSDYRSIGFSNAVFAVWGCLIGLTWREPSRSGIKRRLGFGAGLALFALIGLGEGSDLTGHLAGLVFGLAVGLAFSGRERLASGFLFGRFFPGLGLAAVIFSWIWALNF